jgi:predicted DsbA family dithiol-disulfide isomerase
MKSFLLHVSGRGRGCKHTIGCNTRQIRFQAMSMAEAEKLVWKVKEFAELLDEDADIPILEDAVLYEIAAGTRLDLEAVRTFRREKQEAAEQEQREAEERAAYEKLKAKYEGDRT